MRSPIAISRPARAGCVWHLGGAVLTLTACLMVTAHRASAGSPRPTGWHGSPAVWACSPAAPLDVTAVPAVTTPTADVARFGIRTLSIVAATVCVDRLRRVNVARIGGLHGP